MKTTRRVVDTAVQTAYNGEKQIVWFDVYAGENAMAKYNEWLPQDTFDAIEYFRVALKGPLDDSCRRWVSEFKCDVTSGA